jgi:hypothetical protein
MPLTAYETKVLHDIHAWQRAEPGVVPRLFAKASGPASKAMQTLVPEGVLTKAFDLARSAAQRVAGRRSILRVAGVAAIEDLKQAPLTTCDRAATHVRRRAMATAGASGAALGVAGAPGMIADVATLLVLALRTVHRTGLCYGEDCFAGDDDTVALAVFALASVESRLEKTAVLAALHDRDADAGALAHWRDSVESAAERELAKGAMMLSAQTLARRISANLGMRLSAGAVPVLGALVGGSVNAWYVHDLATVARYVFQERWLRAR